jgi:hypothetical protein
VASKITFAHTGIFNLQWSGQFQNTDNAQHDIEVWLRINGSDVVGSAGLISIPARKSTQEGDEGHVVIGWNYLLSLIGGDYVEFYWSSESTNVSLQYYTGGTTPTYPTTASLIITATQQSGIMAGTGITALNGLTSDVQTFATGETGTDFNIDSSGSTHTFNIPSASNLARGLVSIIAQTFAGVKTFLSAPILDSLTASQILATDGSKAVQSLDTTTYPDLTELSYVKGVTSAIQTQLNNKLSVASSILSGNLLGNTIATGVTSYACFFLGAPVAVASEFQRRNLIPIAGTLKRFYVNNGNQPATGSLVYTIRKNGADTAFVITVAGGSLSGVFSNTTSTLSVSAGDFIGFKITNNASTTSGAIVGVSIVLEI